MMKKQEFLTLAETRVLPVAIQVDQQTFPVMPVKLQPIVCLAFSDNDITLIEVFQLINSLAPEPFDRIPFSEIAKVELKPVKKLTTGLSILGFRINLALTICLTTGTAYQFECEDMVMLPRLSEILSQAHLPISDTFALVEKFKNGPSNQEVYAHLSETLADENDQELLSMTQMRKRLKN
jgi:hypothetical protein